MLSPILSTRWKARLRCKGAGRERGKGGLQRAVQVDSGGSAIGADCWAETSGQTHE